MSSVVVLPTAVRRQTRQPRVATLVVCGQPDRCQPVVHTASGLGTETEVLASGADVRDYADRHAPPDACLILTPLPDGPVLPLIRMLRARGWEHVVVLSGRADARAVHAALIAGVRSVVVHGPGQEVHATPRQVHGSVKLSQRELQVLEMVAGGQSNRAVGAALGLSALTVKSHLARIARKLGSGDRAQMVATAIRSGHIA